MSDFSCFLFARPSFIEGIARLLDFGNTLTEYNYSENGAVADQRAAWADWSAISDDLKVAAAAEARRVRQQIAAA